MCEVGLMMDGRVWRQDRLVLGGGGDDGADPGVDVLFKLSKLTVILSKLGGGGNQDSQLFTV